MEPRAGVRLLLEATADRMADRGCDGHLRRKRVLHTLSGAGAAYPDCTGRVPDRTPALRYGSGGMGRARLRDAARYLRLGRHHLHGCAAAAILGAGAVGPDRAAAEPKLVAGGAVGDRHRPWAQCQVRHGVLLPVPAGLRRHDAVRPRAGAA